MERNEFRPIFLVGCPRSGTTLLRLILSNGVWLTAAGLALGVAGSLAMTKLIATLLFGVTPRDPLTLGAAAITLAVVALLACYVPARRAARLDPLIALRCE